MWRSPAFQRDEASRVGGEGRYGESAEDFGFLAARDGGNAAQVAGGEGGGDGEVGDDAHFFAAAGDFRDDLVGIAEEAAEAGDGEDYGIVVYRLHQRGKLRG